MMRKISTLTALLLAGTFLYAQQHPGGMHTRPQIAYVKAQIKQQREPFVTAYRQLMAKADSVQKLEHRALADLSIPGYYVKPKEHRENSLSIQGDGFAAYCSALAWQLSGQQRYAEKALYFLNAWGRINKQYSDFDGPLVLSYSGGSMVIAAELMHPYKNWKKADRENFAGWVKNVYRKACNEIRGRKNNWADWGRYGSLLAGHYLHDTADFAENVRLIKSDVFHKIAADGHMPEETRREANGIWYTYFSLAPLTASFWIIHNVTGENLFTLQEGDKSIKKALDYLFYYNGHPQEWPWFKNPNIANPATATGYWPANLFEAMQGIYKESAWLAFVVPHRPLVYEKHHFAWTFPTLMTVIPEGYQKP